MFLAIDGIDGSGKSTAAEGIASFLEESGRSVELIEHPSPGLWGRICAGMLLRDGKVYRILAPAFMMADMLSIPFAVRRARRNNADLIVVRYSLSCFFVGGRKARILHRLFTSVMPRPDMNVMIDTDPDVAMKRIVDRGGELETFENLDSMESVRRAMLSVPDVIVIDGNGTREDVTHNIIGLMDSPN